MSVITYASRVYTELVQVNPVERSNRRSVKKNADKYRSPAQIAPTRESIIKTPASKMEIARKKQRYQPTNRDNASFYRLLAVASIK
jgi:hypothetical protein